MNSWDRPNRCFDWSAARIALVTRRWVEGASASTIASELGPGVSRCAVLGKIHRLKLAQPDFKPRLVRKERKPGKRPRRPARKARRITVRESWLKTAFDGASAYTGAEESVQARTAFGRACTLAELTADTCRWPVGHPGTPDFVFCGAAPFKAYPYCLAHCLVGYRPPGEAAAPPLAQQRAA